MKSSLLICYAAIGLLMSCCVSTYYDDRIEIARGHVIEVSAITDRVKRGGNPDTHLEDYRCPVEHLMICEVWGSTKSCRCWQ